MASRIFKSEYSKTGQLTSECDKRYFPRWEVNRRVEYGAGRGGIFRAYTKDLSLEGTALVVFGNPPEQDRFHLRIFLAYGDYCETVGHVVWSRLETTHKTLGITFEGLSKRSQQLISGHAFGPSEDRLLIYVLIRSFALKSFYFDERGLRPNQNAHLHPHKEPSPRLQEPAGWPNKGTAKEIGKGTGLHLSG